MDGFEFCQDVGDYIVITGAKIMEFRVVYCFLEQTGHYAYFLFRYGVA